MDNPKESGYYWIHMDYEWTIAWFNGFDFWITLGSRRSFSKLPPLCFLGDKIIIPEKYKMKDEPSSKTNCL